MSGMSTDWSDMMQSMGLGSQSLRKKVRKNINKFDLTFGIDEAKNKQAVEYLEYAAKRYEARLAKYQAKGKARSLRKAEKVQAILDQIYERLRPPASGLESLTGPGLRTGAARTRAESRAATIYLGGASSVLGLMAPGQTSVDLMGGSMGGSSGGSSIPSTRHTAREFLGQYYGTGALPNATRRSYGYQIP